MKEKQIIDKYITTLEDKEKYFENKNLIYELLKFKAFILVKKLKYKNNKEVMKSLIKKENKIIKKIKKIENKNKILEDSENAKHLLNMNFMSLKDKNLIIDDQLLSFFDNGAFRKKEDVIDGFLICKKGNVIDLTVMLQDENLNFLLLNESFYNNIDKEKIKKYNYIVYRGDVSMCIKNFMTLLSLDFEKDKVKKKKLRRIYDKY